MFGRATITLGIGPHSSLITNCNIIGRLTEELENIAEERQEAVLLTVVDWDAEELGFSDERRLWTRGTHVHHVLNTVLLQTQTRRSRV